MNAGKINFFNHCCPPLKRMNFAGGYKDLKEKDEKYIFDRTLDLCASFYKMPDFKEESVEINGEKLKLTTFSDGFYMLKSSNDEVMATMKTLDRTEKTSKCDNDFYSENKGAVEISLIFSKGKGMGSFLVKEAVKRSVEKGYEGRIILDAGIINRSIGSPIPFYYKIGFKAYDTEAQKCIEKKMRDYDETKTFVQGEKEIPMYLAPEKIKDFLD